MPLAAFQQNWLLWMTPEWGSKSDPKIGFADRASPVRKSVPGRSHQGDGRTEESQAQPNTPMNPSDLLAETVFGKRASSKKHHPAGPHFGVQNLAPKVGALIRRKGFAAPVLGSEIWTPKRGPTNVVFPTFLGVSACAFNALRRGQACWSKRSRVTFFDDAPSEATCAPPQGRPIVSATGFWTGFRTLFLGPTQRLFFPSRGPTSLRTFPTHWFPRLKQLLCVRESESRMYVAQLWPSACPCTLIVVPMRVLFPKKKENRSARFTKVATSSYLVDVSPTHSFARCVGLVGADLDLGGRTCVWTLRDYSSSKPTSDPARSPTCVRLSV